MKKFSLFFLVISLLVIGCSQKNATYEIFEKNHRFAIAESNTDTSTLVYDYTKVEEVMIDSDGTTYLKISTGFSGYGLCKNDQLIISPIYRSIYLIPSNDSFLWECRKNGDLSDLFSLDGKLICDSVNVSQYNENICEVRKNDSIFLCIKEKLIGPFSGVGEIDREKKTLAFISFDKKESGVVHYESGEKIEFPYEETYYLKFGLYFVRDHNNNEGIVDENEKIIVPIKEWKCILHVENDTTITYWDWDKNDWGYYDLNGKHSFSKKFPNLSLQREFISGSAVVMDETTMLYGLLFKTGELIVPCEYEFYKNNREEEDIIDEENIIFSKNDIEAFFDRKTGQIIKYN